MTRLALVADASEPFDYTRLPAGVVAIAGYIGGDTPHVWSQPEIDQVLATGRAFWPIWTAPSRGQAIDTAQGARDGSGTVAALRDRGLLGRVPVFYDVEYADWAADPLTAGMAITAWKRTVHAGGHSSAYAYVPYTAHFDWVAYWDNVRPTSLPAGWCGQQYGGNAVNGACDLSVFDLDLVEADMPAQVSDPGIQAVLQAIQNVTSTLAWQYGDKAHPASQVNLKAELDAIANADQHLPTLSQIVAALPPGSNVTAHDVAVELVKLAAGGIPPVTPPAG